MALLVSWVKPRAFLWLTLGLLDYILTTALANLTLHPFISALTDAAVCVSIFFTCKYLGGHRWELPVFTGFQFMVIANLSYMVAVAFAKGEGKVVPDTADYVYEILLEGGNWIVLLTIISVGTSGMVDAVLDSYHTRLRNLHRFVRYASAPAKVHTLWWAGKA